MEYNQSEIRELKNNIIDNIKILYHYTQIYIPNKAAGLSEIIAADVAVSELDNNLELMKDYIIDTDDYNLAVELESEFGVVWEKYVDKVIYEKDRLGVMPGHYHFGNIRDTMVDWVDWIHEYEDKNRLNALNPYKNDTVVDKLPKIFDILDDDKVVVGINKFEFISKVSDCSIVKHINKTTKFKGFVRLIKQYMTDEWYKSICKNMGQAAEQMQKYNTDNTADFENKIEKILRK